MKNEKEILQLAKEYNWGTVIINYIDQANEIIDKYYKEFDDDTWTRVSIAENLSLNNIRKFKDKLNWISFTDAYNYIDDNFVEEFKDYIDWTSIPFKKSISDNIIEKYFDLIDWEWVDEYIELHKDLITVSDRELKYIKEYKDRKEKK